MIKKILIANRGEIACRIIRTCQKLGIKTVAIHSDVDSESMHTKLADERISLGGNEASETYLSIQKIINAAKKVGADAVHPGYGFLSENAEFAAELGKNKIIFIGPRPETIELMGDKVRAKALAKKCGVPLIPGHDSEKEIETFIKEHGLPVLIKAAAGGGGRGMRKIYDHKDLPDAIKGARREAESFFKDGRLFVEKLIENGRHIEVQMFGDQHGDAIHLFDRDCTAQRRHQKVIEEAPSFFVAPTTRQAILDAAVKLCKEAGYVGAGTAEFLLAPDGKFYFLEVNSRLQVEHPVTETVLNLDLVELQIRVARGEALSSIVNKEQLKPSGYAIECRICAESPDDNFMTSTGKILSMNTNSISSIPGVRIDAGFYAGDTITHYYDSLIAKLIVHEKTRSEAIEKTKIALRNFHILGIKTNIPFLLQILESHSFSSAEFHVNSAETLVGDSASQDNRRALAGALYLLAMEHARNATTRSSWYRHFGWRQSGTSVTNNLKVNLTPTSFVIENLGRDTFRILKSSSCDVLFHLSKVTFTKSGALSFLLDNRNHGCITYKIDHKEFVATHFGIFEIEPHFPNLKSHSVDTKHISEEVKAPFPGKVISVKITANSAVEAGQTLLLLESMKMEHPLKAPLAGSVKEVLVKDGEVIEANKVLVRLAFT